MRLNLQLIPFVLLLFLVNGCADIQRRIWIQMDPKILTKELKSNGTADSSAEPTKMWIYNGCGDVELISIGPFPLPIIPWPPGIFNYFNKSEETIMGQKPLVVTISPVYEKNSPLDYVVFHPYDKQNSYNPSKVKIAKSVGNGKSFEFPLSCLEAKRGTLIIRGFESQPISFGDINSKTSASWILGR